MYDFSYVPDGTTPQSALTHEYGYFFGTTEFGGAFGAGTVYRVSPSGDERVLYSFDTLSSDGAYPLGPLLSANGVFYGTTYLGDGNEGTVYEISAGGVETVLHRFSGGVDGASPKGGLVYLAGALYGTTTAGGGAATCPGGCGTVFMLDLSSGEERTIHRFVGGSDGAAPEAGLTNVGGLLYGTTSAGGPSGNSTVFRITTAGAKHILYSFKGGSDGSSPLAAPIDVNGTLYGTTTLGGTASSEGSGTVFSLTPSGVEHVLHSFGGEPDGAEPQAGLVDLNGELYGTTLLGGGTKENGAVFAVTAAGKESIVYRFSGGDGAAPAAALIAVDGVLYGTTSTGGSDFNGTVFSLSP